MIEINDSNHIKKKSKSKRRINIGSFGIAFVILVLINIGGISFVSANHVINSNPEFCSNCHIMEFYVNSFNQSNHMDSLHNQAGLNCIDCHFDYTIADKVGSFWNYISGDYDRVWRQRKVEDDMCKACHISMEYQAAKTDFLRRNPHLSHWEELRCASCHISHDNQVDYCSRCHDNGGQRMIEDPKTPRAPNPFASDAN